MVTSTASTNADVAAPARAASAGGTRDRRRAADRGSRPARSAVGVARARRGAAVGAASAGDLRSRRWPLIPLIAGLAVVEAVLAVGQVEASLKWPNDVLVDDLKLGGILVERVDDAVVIGIGVNVSTRRERTAGRYRDQPRAGRWRDRPRDPRQGDARAVSIVDTPPGATRRGAGATVIPAYRERCETIGHHVDVQLPGGVVVQGKATGIDDDGRLLVRDDAGAEHAFLVGDVTHVRKVS